MAAVPDKAYSQPRELLYVVQLIEHPVQPRGHMADSII